MAFARELGADALARFIDADAVDHAVGPGEIDIFENAQPFMGAVEGPRRAQSFRAGDDHLAGLDVAQELRADDVERAAFRGDDPRLAELAQHQRPHAQGVAHSDQAFLRQRGQRIGAFDLAQRVDHALLDAELQTGRDEMDDHFSVAGRLEQAAAPYQLLAQLVGIGEIAVVADGETAEFEIGEKRLDVAHRHFAGGRVAHMADPGMPRQPADHVLGAEILADMAHGAMGVKLLAVIGDDPGRFLAAML